MILGESLASDINDYRISSARNIRNSAYNSVNAKNGEITEAEKAPPPVIQPLPSSDDKALKILFFLYMSDEFKTLSRLSLVAQQLLVPRPWVALCGGQDGNQNVNVFDQIKVKQKYNSWCGHYNDSQTCIYHTPREKREGSYQWLDISMHSNVPEPKDVGPSRVDSLRGPNDGIWYPDDNNVRLVWRGGSLPHDKHKSNGEFNPFTVQNSLTGNMHDLNFRIFRIEI